MGFGPETKDNADRDRSIIHQLRSKDLVTVNKVSYNITWNHDPARYHPENSYI